MEVLFIVDGGPDVGLGHVYNSTGLCAALPAEANPTFLTASGEQVVEKVSDFGYEVHSVDATTDIPMELSRRHPDSVVIDRPDIPESFLDQVHGTVSTGTRVVAIGDLGEYLSSNAPEYCDAIVDLDIRNGYSHSAIRYDDHSGTLHLAGLQHFVLRPQFYQSETTATVPDTVESILLIFGASDPSNYTTRALDLLLSRDRQFDINVVLGPGYRHPETLVSEFDTDNRDRDCITVERDIADVASRMRSADLLLTSPGLTMIEALFLRTPVVAFHQNTLQQLFQDYDFVYPPERMEDIVNRVDEVVSLFNDFFNESYFDPEIGRTAVVEAVSEIDNEMEEIYETMRPHY